MYTCMFNSCYSEPFDDYEADYYQLHNGAANICDNCADKILAGDTLTISSEDAAELRSDIEAARAEYHFIAKDAA